MLRYLLTAAILLFAGPALADANGFWQHRPDEVMTNGSQVRSIAPQGGGASRGLAYYDFAGTTSSVKLDVTGCDVLHVFFNGNEDAAAETGATIAVYMDSEPNTAGNEAGSVNSSIRVLNGAGETPLTGDAGTGLASIANIPGGGYLWIDVVANGSSDDARVWVTCHD